MQKFWNWIMKSSVNPGETSLAVKGVLVGAVTIFTMVLGFAHVQVGDLTPLVDGVVTAVQAFFALVAAIAFVWGLVRKLYLTATGQNAPVSSV